jgi:hypothetical protein
MGIIDPRVHCLLGVGYKWCYIVINIEGWRVEDVDGWGNHS